MADKAIITVGVDDTAFKKFQEDVAKFKKDMASGGGAPDFGAVVKSLDEFGSKFKTVKKELQEADKIGFGDHFSKAITSTLEPLRKLNEGFGRILSTVASTTRMLLGWTGIFGVFSGLVSGIGFSSLARSVSEARTTAGGLGVSTGELSAFDLNYRRFGLGADTLRNVVQGQQNLGSDQYRGLLQLGFTPEEIRRRSAADLAQAGIERGVAAFRRANGSELTLNAQGVTSVFSMEQLRRLSAASDAERAAQGQAYQRDRNALNVSDPINQSWQNFRDALDRSWQKLEKVFVIGLDGLTGPIGKLTDAFAEAVKAFFNNGTVKEALTSLAGDLDWLAKKIGSEDFKADVDSFIALLKRMVQGVEWAVQKVEGWFGSSSAPLGPGQYGPPTPPGIFDGGAVSAPRFFGDGQVRNKDYGPRLNYYAAVLRSQGVSENLIAGMLANFEAESGLDPNQSTNDGGVEAYGLGQWHPDRQAFFQQFAGHDIHGSSADEQLRFALWELTHNESAARASIGEPKTPFEAGSLYTIFDERPKDKFAKASVRGKLADEIYRILHDAVIPPDATSSGRQTPIPNLVIPPNGAPISSRDTNIRITLENRTGANAHLSVQQLAVPT